MSRDQIKAELDRLTRNGVLMPQDVVEAARDPESLLHHQFEWNDGKAAQAYRLAQARQLIRVYVVLEPVAAAAPMRAFVSLSTDRKAGGGYRQIAEVVSNTQLYGQMLADALNELRGMRQKYQRIKELERVFAAAEDVERQVEL